MEKYGLKPPPSRDGSGPVWPRLPAVSPEAFRAPQRAARSPRDRVDRFRAGGA